MIQGCFVTRGTSFDSGYSRENNEKKVGVNANPVCPCT